MNNFWDYSILNPLATVEDIKNGCIFATKHKLKSVCVSSGYVNLASMWHNNVCSVISFPHGNAASSVKYFESIEAVRNGAKELDIVINYGRYLEGDLDVIRRDLRHICRYAKGEGVIVKAILETCYHTKYQLIDACKRCAGVGVDFVKTSTGFGIDGAKTLDVAIMLYAVKGTGVQVKASGGIKTRKRARMFLDMGCTRIGSSCYE